MCANTESMKSTTASTENRDVSPPKFDSVNTRTVRRREYDEWRHENSSNFTVDEDIKTHHSQSISKTDGRWNSYSQRSQSKHSWDSQRQKRAKYKTPIPLNN